MMLRWSAYQSNIEKLLAPAWDLVQQVAYQLKHIQYI